VLTMMCPMLFPSDWRCIGCIAILTRPSKYARLKMPDPVFSVVLFNLCEFSDTPLKSLKKVFLISRAFFHRVTDKFYRREVHLTRKSRSSTVWNVSWNFKNVMVLSLRITNILYEKNGDSPHTFKFFIHSTSRILSIFSVCWICLFGTVPIFFRN
jgi:hypothetical protein